MTKAHTRGGGLLHPDRWDLVSANDLAAYHAVRRDLYRTFAELLSDTGALDVERAHARVTRARLRSFAIPAVLLALGAIEAATAESLAEERSRFHDRGAARCPRASEARAAALRQAGVPSSPGRTAELLALSALADRTARALRAGDVAEASALVDAQARFIRGHALRCLTEYAAAFVASGEPALSALGTALVRQVRDDAMVLGGSGPDSWDESGHQGETP